MNSQSGTYTLKAVFHSGPLAGEMLCEKSISIGGVLNTAVPVPADKDGGFLVGKPAPAWHAAHWVGAPTTPALTSGKVLLLTFWATWCAPCIAEFPEIERFYREVKRRGALVAGMTPADGNRLEVARIASQVTFPNAIDAPPSLDTGLGATFEAYHVYSLPQHIVIDRKGIVRYHGGSLEEASRVVRGLVAR